MYTQDIMVTHIISKQPIIIKPVILITPFLFFHFLQVQQVPNTHRNPHSAYLLLEYRSHQHKTATHHKVGVVDISLKFLLCLYPFISRSSINSNRYFCFTSGYFVWSTSDRNISSGRAYIPSS